MKKKKEKIRFICRKCKKRKKEKEIKRVEKGVYIFFECKDGCS